MCAHQLDKKWIQDIAEKAIPHFNGIPVNAEVKVYFDSERIYQLSTFASVRIIGKDYLLVVSEEKNDYGFEGQHTEIYNHDVMLCPENNKNAEALRSIFSFTNPSVIGKTKSTFGVGDRLGIAGPGHLRVFDKYDLLPVLAQQSLRELDLMGRTFSNIIDAASWAVFKFGYTAPWAADGDHLKHAEDVRSAVKQGCTMITADLSDHLDFSVNDKTDAEISAEYIKLDAEYRNRIESSYSGRISIDNDLYLDFSREKTESVVLTYRNAVEHACNLYEAALENCDSLDFEISIDETEQPTSLEAHYFVAKELEYRDVKYTSIAPRYTGEFQKGIDYIGDLNDFEADFSGHAAIAGALGYKISIHSSSDKFSAYPIIAANRKGSFHLKTSGTNWLIALEVVASNEPELFREIFKYAYKIFPVAKAYYHVTPDMSIQTDIDELDDQSLLKVFENNTDRQVLHISYGEVFKLDKYKQKLFSVFNSNISDYWNRLEKHIGRHVELLEG